MPPRPRSATLLVRHFLEQLGGRAGRRRTGGAAALGGHRTKTAAGRLREIFAAQVLPAMARAGARRRRPRARRPGGEPAARPGLRPLRPQAAAAGRHAGRRDRPPRSGRPCSGTCRCPTHEEASGLAPPAPEARVRPPSAPAAPAAPRPRACGRGTPGRARPPRASRRRCRMFVGQPLGGRGVEDVAGLAEGGEGVGVHHLGPHVGVVARRVAVAGEDVLEVRRPRGASRSPPACRAASSVAACAAIGSAGAGPAWKSRSTSAEARYSTVAKPWSKLRAAISRSHQLARHRLRRSRRAARAPPAPPGV